ncbi:MAG: hypothetical protein ACXVDD_20025, partial [Polyangia bacterium]
AAASATQAAAAGGAVAVRVTRAPLVAAAVRARVTSALVVAAIVCAGAAAGAREAAISVVAGTRCFDVRAADGGCVVVQQVALVGAYGELHGAFVANDFVRDAGLVVGATWGGDVGSPFFRFRHDRLRLAVRLNLDSGLLLHDQLRGTTHTTIYDVDLMTFTLGPQLWVRISPSAFFIARAAAGGSIFFLDLDHPNISPTVDAALGFGFDL